MLNLVWLWIKLECWFFTRGLGIAMGFPNDLIKIGEVLAKNKTEHLPNQEYIFK